MLAIAFLHLLQKPRIETYDVGGVPRQALVIAPASAGPAALVFAFHGHGGNMNNADRTFGIERRWPEAIAVYPQGLPSKGMTDPKGALRGWQQSATDYDGRDLAFFDVMLASLEKEFRVDPNRVYVTGHSNGGRFTYLLWAKRAPVFAAVAPSASPAIGLISELKPLPAFIVAGQNDRIVPFATQKLSIDAVRAILNTSPAKAKVNGYTSIETGPNGLELGTYIFPGPHSLPSEAADQIVEFFKRHRK